VTLAELVAALERRAADAERMQAHAPVSVVLRDVLADLRAADGTAAAPTVMPDAPAEERYLTTEQVEEMLALPKGYAYDHKRQLGGVKVGKYLRFPESAVRRRLERTR
jgi:exonuclease VII large subunit